jgi:hypothetical protein
VSAPAGRSQTGAAETPVEASDLQQSATEPERRSRWMSDSVYRVTEVIGVISFKYESGD